MIYPPVYPANIIMSVTPRDYKFVKKIGFFIELFSLKLVEANYKAYKQLKANRDMLVQKNPDFAEKVRARGGYLEQYVNDFHVRDGCLWLEELLAIPFPVRRPIINRIHSYHHGKANMLDPAWDICYPCIHWSLA